MLQTTDHNSYQKCRFYECRYNLCAFLQINLMKPILARDRAGSNSFPAFIFKTFNRLIAAVVSEIRLFAAWPFM